jgi:hypothetical protein
MKTINKNKFYSAKKPIQLVLGILLNLCLLSPALADELENARITSAVQFFQNQKDIYIYAVPELDSWLKRLSANHATTEERNILLAHIKEIKEDNIRARTHIGQITESEANKLRQDEIELRNSINKILTVDGLVLPLGDLFPATELGLARESIQFFKSHGFMFGKIIPEFQLYWQHLKTATMQNGYPL